MYETFKPKYTPLLVEVTLESGAVTFQVVDEPSTNWLYPDSILTKWGFPTTQPFKDVVEESFSQNRAFSDEILKKSWLGLVGQKTIVTNGNQYLGRLTSNTNEKLINTRLLVREWEQICFQMLCEKLEELQR